MPTETTPLARSTSWVDLTDDLPLLDDPQASDPLHAALQVLPQWVTSLENACEKRTNLLLAEGPALAMPCRQLVVGLFAHAAIRADHLALPLQAAKGPAPSGLADVLERTTSLLSDNDKEAFGALLAAPAIWPHFTAWIDHRMAYRLESDPGAAAKEQAVGELGAMINRLARRLRQPLLESAVASGATAVLPTTPA